jgi:hypothetical protein
MKSALLHVPVLNSLLYLRDPSIEHLPVIDGLAAVWSTPSCVAVSCLPDSEGETAIRVGAASEVGLERTPLFDGQIDTPSRTIVLETVLRKMLLREHVAAAHTRVRIWTNGHRATDKVIIGLV